MGAFNGQWGAEYELLITEYFGVQARATYIGAGGGVNIHFDPWIKSSYLSLQYLYMGLGTDRKKRLMSLNLGYRSKHWFTFQVGLGLPTNEVDSFPRRIGDSNFILTGAIGVYFPF